MKTIGADIQPVHELLDLIRSAFLTVEKEDGIGIREAIARDDYAKNDEIASARSKDIEAHWWEIPQDLKGMAGTVLGSTDVPGFRFLAPVAMSDALSSPGVSDSGMSLFFHLCLTHPTSDQPHHFHAEFLDYLKSVKVPDVANFYAFDKQQTAAIARFFDWWMRQSRSYLYADREKTIGSIEKMHAKNLQQADANSYTLTLEQAIAVWHEQCRILRDWVSPLGI